MIYIFLPCDPYLLQLIIVQRFSISNSKEKGSDYIKIANCYYHCIFSSLLGIKSSDNNFEIPTTEAMKNHKKHLQYFMLMIPSLKSYIDYNL